MKKIAVMISDAGTGSNLKAIVAGIKSNKINAKIGVVVSANLKSPGLKIAKQNHLRIFVSKDNEEIINKLNQLNIDCVALCGWKKIISDKFIDNFQNRILNIHPGLIPDHNNETVQAPDKTNALWNRGKFTEKAIQNFFDNQSTYAGSTVHFLTHEFDFGPVLKRCFVKIKKTDDVSSLYSRLKKEEHKILIKSLNQVINNPKNLDNKKILIIGSGGREHALGWKVRQSDKVNKIYFAPGNGGTHSVGENVNIQVNEINKLVKFAKQNQIGLTIVGPELPLSLGIVDKFQKEKLAIFGPSKKSARLESSKAWAVKFMQKYKIPHPKTFIVRSLTKAVNIVNSLDWTGFVIKIDGLAAGKGVFVVDSKKEAISVLKKIMNAKSDDKILIQEKLEGYEISIIAFADGKNSLPLLSAQDHKRIFDQDKGPNTGGMGAYAPVPGVGKKLLDLVKKQILEPTIKGMKKEGCPYVGAIYPGLMITKDGPKVLEYNARFGDPETQPQMVLLETDLIDIINTCLNGKLDKIKLKFKTGSAICVVLASKGYPGKYKDGEIISGLDNANFENVIVFHAGTTMKKGQILTSGGRVLGITAKGANISEARKNVYQFIDKKKVFFKNMYFRHDIAHKSFKS